MTSPVTFTTLLIGLVNAVLQLVVSFGVNLSNTQDVSITAVVNALLLVAAYLWAYFRKPKAAGG